MVPEWYFLYNPELAIDHHRGLTELTRLSYVYSGQCFMPRMHHINHAKQCVLSVRFLYLHRSDFCLKERSRLFSIMMEWKHSRHLRSRSLKPSTELGNAAKSSRQSAIESI